MIREGDMKLCVLVICLSIPNVLSTNNQPGPGRIFATGFNTVTDPQVGPGNFLIRSRSLLDNTNLDRRVNFEPGLGRGNPQERRLAELVPILREVRRWTHDAAMVAGRPPAYITPGEPDLFEAHFHRDDGESRITVADYLSAVYINVNERIVTIDADPPEDTCAATPGRPQHSYRRRIKAWIVTRSARNLIYLVSSDLGL